MKISTGKFYTFWVRFNQILQFSTTPEVPETQEADTTNEIRRCRCEKASDGIRRFKQRNRHRSDTARSPARSSPHWTRRYRSATDFSGKSILDVCWVVLHVLDHTENCTYPRIVNQGSSNVRSATFTTVEVLGQTVWTPCV